MTNNEETNKHRYLVNHQTDVNLTLRDCKTFAILTIREKLNEIKPLLVTEQQRETYRELEARLEGYQVEMKPNPYTEKFIRDAVNDFRHEFKS